MAGRNLRSFIAFDLEPAVKKTLMREIGFLQMAGADVHWVKEASLHVTVRFLGDLAPEEILPVAAAIRRATADVPISRPTLRGLTAFPSVDDPRTIVVALEGEVEPVQRFFRNLQEELKKAGFRPEPRPLRLHVTLGRVKGDRFKDELKTRLAEAADRGFGDTVVAKFDLVLSELDPRGPTYTIMEEFELEGD